MYGYIQAVVDEHRAYQEQPHNILYFKRENSDDPLEYLNTTFSIRTLYSGDSFVVDFKDKMYSIMNNHGQIILSEVIFNEGHGSGNFPAYDVVNHTFCCVLHRIGCASRCRVASRCIPF